MNKKQENSLKLLKKFCKENKDRLNFLEESIINKKVLIDDNGDISYSSEYILKDKELQFKTMSVENNYLEIKVGVINLINLNTNCKVEKNDIVIDKLSKFIVKNIMRSIKNKTTLEYWESLNN